MWVLRWIREIKLKNLTTADSLFMALMFVAFIQEVKLTILICAYYVYCLQMEQHLNQVRERSEERLPTTTAGLGRTVRAGNGWNLW